MPVNSNCFHSIRARHPVGFVTFSLTLQSVIFDSAAEHVWLYSKTSYLLFIKAVREDGMVPPTYTNRQNTCGCVLPVCLPSCLQVLESCLLLLATWASCVCHFTLQSYDKKSSFISADTRKHMHMHAGKRKYITCG